jgi:hypothetical protein
VLLLLLCCAGLCCAGLGWAGLGWAGLGWAGLGWAAALSLMSWPGACCGSAAPLGIVVCCCGALRHEVAGHAGPTGLRHPGCCCYWYCWWRGCLCAFVAQLLTWPAPCRCCRCLGRRWWASIPCWRRAGLPLCIRAARSSATSAAGWRAASGGRLVALVLALMLHGNGCLARGRGAVMCERGAVMCERGAVMCERGMAACRMHVACWKHECSSRAAAGE